MGRYLNKWRYYLSDRESLQKIDGSLAQNNIFCLQILSLVASILLLVFLFFPLLIERMPIKVISYLVCAGASGAIYLAARRRRREKGLTNRRVYPLFLTFFLTVVALGIFIGVVQSPGDYAIDFFIFLICGQVLFVFTPLHSLLLNLCVFLVFSALCIWLKPVSIWPTDVSNAFLSGMVSMLFNWYVGTIIVREKLSARKLEQQRNVYKEQSTRDELTGLWNRRGFFQNAEKCCRKWRRQQTNVCVLMIDLDFFKRYNDFFGHPKGDEVLRAVGGVLRGFKDSLSARVGGEEFIMLWAQQDGDMAEQKAQLIQSRIHELEIPHPQSEVSQTLTASFGIYITESDNFTNIDELYANADLALYEAKRQGRDRIVRCVNKEHQFTSVSN